MGSEAWVFSSKSPTFDLVQVFGGPRRSASCPQNPIIIVPSHIIMFGHSYDTSYHFFYPIDGSSFYGKKPLAPNVENNMITSTLPLFMMLL